MVLWESVFEEYSSLLEYVDKLFESDEDGDDDDWSELEDDSDGDTNN